MKRALKPIRVFGAPEKAHRFQEQQAAASPPLTIEKCAVPSSSLISKYEKELALSKDTRVGGLEWSASVLGRWMVSDPRFYAGNRSTAQCDGPASPELLCCHPVLPLQCLSHCYM